MSAPENSAGVPTPDELQQLKRAREAALLRQWTAGRALAPAEMAEVAHILPAAILASPPPPKARYLHDYAHYASAFGYDVRNIKRFVAIGKRARLLPPLDDPAQLADWWEQLRHHGHLKQQVPARILDIVARHRSTAPASASPATTGQPPQSSPPSDSAAPPQSPPPPAHDRPGTTKINFAELEAIGLEGAVRELTLQLSAAQKDLRSARETGLDEITITRRQKSFDATLDSLRKTEKSWQDLQKDRGDLAPVSDFRKDLTVIATTLRGMLRRRADNICAALAATLNPEHLGLVRAAVEAEGQRELALLRSARHWPRDSDDHR